MGIITIAFAGLYCKSIFLAIKKMIIKDIAEFCRPFAVGNRSTFEGYQSLKIATPTTGK